MPQVSIMTPCFNSAKTLPLALASAVAQDHEDWEMVLVDDGSTDHPEEVVERLGDERVRLFRLERNMGRGVARQVALDRARGEYLCFLDADDWMYPGRISNQVQVLSSDLDLALVGSGLAVLGVERSLRGVRCTGPVGPRIRPKKPWKRLGLPPMAFPASMLRMDAAKKACFDPRFRLVEDTDFLIRVLLVESWAAMPDVLYAYAEHESVTPEKVRQAHRFIRMIYAGYADRFPLASGVGILKSFAKLAVYRVAAEMGFHEFLITRRSRAPTPKEADEFTRARKAVFSTRDRLFGLPGGD